MSRNERAGAAERERERKSLSEQALIHLSLARELSAAESQQSVAQRAAMGNSHSATTTTQGYPDFWKR